MTEKTMTALRKQCSISFHLLSLGQLRDVQGNGRAIQPIQNPVEYSSGTIHYGVEKRVNPFNEIVYGTVRFLDRTFADVL